MIELYSLDMLNDLITQYIDFKTKNEDYLLE